MKLPQDQWLVRDSPHLRILSDELSQAVRDKLQLAAQSFGRSAKDRKKKAYRADLYPKALIRPICGGCGQPMILGRSLGKYQSFCCHNALHGIRGCTNRGSKSARIIDELSRPRTNGPKMQRRARRPSRLRMTARKPPARQQETVMEPHEEWG